jgi:hypothetical protein
VDPREGYQEHRLDVLGRDAAAVGWQPTPRLPDVYGAVVEVGLPWGSASLVALADGTAEHVSSTGRNPLASTIDDLDVVAAVRGLLAVVQARLGDLEPTEDVQPPAPGHVRVHALTATGRRMGTAREEPLAAAVHDFSPLYFAAQEVERQLRLMPDQPAARS